MFNYTYKNEVEKSTNISLLLTSKEPLTFMMIVGIREAKSKDEYIKLKTVNLTASPRNIAVFRT